MARPANGTGFRLYFPDAEEEPTNTTPQATSSLDSSPATQHSAESKQSIVGTDNTNANVEQQQAGGTVPLRTPSWQPDTTTTAPDRIDGTTFGRHALMKHRTSLSIPRLEAAQVDEPDQEPNIRSFVDSRRKSSQLAEARRRSSVMKG